ncbi:MAG TPA: M15 family metallopeptidase [Cyclobacteriaceae bacterium]|nr:M15 family metallopeptidase [Cyclobacteriaceae bacterium]
MNRSLFIFFVGVLFSLSLAAYGQSSVSDPLSVDFLESLLDRSLRFDTTSFITQSEIFSTEEPDMWREWALASNFEFGKDRGGLPMIADLKSLHPYFRDKIFRLINTCRKKGIELAVVESYRTKAKQAEYYSMGKEYTQSKSGKSKHQYGLAVDLVPMVKGEPKWDDKVLWRKIGMIGESLGLRWGGRWRSIYDPAHFEWTGGLSTYHLERGVYPAPPDPLHYPCIEEDLEDLKKNWSEWETEQSSLARKN